MSPHIDNKCLLLTGPTVDLELWAQVIVKAEWQLEPWPLLELRSLDVDLVEHIDGLPDWLVVTSSSAMPTLERAVSAMPELLSVPLACVGESTAERLRALGFKTGLDPAQGARALADDLREIAKAGAHLLWPRGTLSDDLATYMREEGFRVEDPVVYETLKLVHKSQPPAASHIFFASPSAVDAWCDQWPHSELCPIAIGTTTQAQIDLRAECFAHASLVLSESRPQALGALLHSLI